MNEEAKAKAVSGAGSLQRSTGSESERQQIIAGLRQKIEAIRRGHATGGYCETEKLQGEERKLARFLDEDIAALKEKHGYSPDPKFKHKDIRALEVERNGFSWQPTLVVKEEH